MPKGPADGATAEDGDGGGVEAEPPPEDEERKKEWGNILEDQRQFERAKGGPTLGIDGHGPDVEDEFGAQFALGQQPSEPMPDTDVGMTPEQAFELHRLGKKVKMAMALSAVKNLDTVFDHQKRADKVKSTMRAMDAAEGLEMARKEYEDFMLSCGIKKDSEFYKRLMEALEVDAGTWRPETGNTREEAPSERQRKFTISSTELKDLFKKWEPPTVAQMEAQPVVFEQSYAAAVELAEIEEFKQAVLNSAPAPVLLPRTIHDVPAPAPPPPEEPQSDRPKSAESTATTVKKPYSARASRAMNSVIPVKPPRPRAPLSEPNSRLPPVSHPPPLKKFARRALKPRSFQAEMDPNGATKPDPAGGVRGGRPSTGVLDSYWLLPDAPGTSAGVSYITPTFPMGKEGQKKKVPNLNLNKMELTIHPRESEGRISTGARGVGGPGYKWTDRPVSRRLNPAAVHQMLGGQRSQSAAGRSARGGHQGDVGQSAWGGGAGAHSFGPDLSRGGAVDVAEDETLPGRGPGRARTAGPGRRGNNFAMVMTPGGARSLAPDAERRAQSAFARGSQDSLNDSAAIDDSAVTFLGGGANFVDPFQPISIPSVNTILPQTSYHIPDNMKVNQDMERTTGPGIMSAEMYNNQMNIPNGSRQFGYPPRSAITRGRYGASGLAGEGITASNGDVSGLQRPISASAAGSGQAVYLAGASGNYGRIAGLDSGITGVGFELEDGSMDLDEALGLPASARRERARKNTASGRSKVQHSRDGQGHYTKSGTLLSSEELPNADHHHGHHHRHHHRRNHRKHRNHHSANNGKDSFDTLGSHPSAATLNGSSWDNVDGDSSESGSSSYSSFSSWDSDDSDYPFDEHGLPKKKPAAPKVSAADETLYKFTLEGRHVEPNQRGRSFRQCTSAGPRHHCQHYLHMHNANAPGLPPPPKRRHRRRRRKKERAKAEEGGQVAAAGGTGQPKAVVLLVEEVDARDMVEPWESHEVTREDGVISI
ncbi:hypothetical protein HK101_002530 [Irineochytrium annulatum]|nr:hypothetical protein HK101_002530 [Irineochytrium annulatum]